MRTSAPPNATLESSQRRSAARHFPRVLREAAAFLLHREKAARIGNGGIDLRPVAHDAGVRQEPPFVSCVVTGYSFRVKAMQCPAVVLSLGEDGVPRKPGLRAFQDQELDELPVLPDRHAPLPCPVGDVWR